MLTFVTPHLGQSQYFESICKFLKVWPLEPNIVSYSFDAVLLIEFAHNVKINPKKKKRKPIAIEINNFSFYGYISPARSKIIEKIISRM